MLFRSNLSILNFQSILIILIIPIIQIIQIIHFSLITCHLIPRVFPCIARE